MPPEERLLSVAEIARRLGVPESTVHYWKNRFAQHLPSSGTGRQKRFRPEAVEVFRIIAEMFSLGHSTQDVMETLSKRFPLTASVEGPPAEAGYPRAACSPDAEVADAAVRMAAAIAKEVGQEIARSIGEGLRQHLSAIPAPAGAEQAALPPVLDSEELCAIRAAVDQGSERMEVQAGEVTRLSAENADLKAKLAVLEAELVRLRKDRRDMEKYLLDKIKAVTT